MLIDLTYFDGAISLPVVGNEDAINAAIATYQEEYMRKVMGESLFLVFLTEASTASGFSGGFSGGFGNGDELTPARWIWVLDGKTYTHNGNTHIWRGIRPAIADYVYWMYRSYSTTYTMPTGETKGKNENSEIVAADLKMVKAWNRMAQLSRDLAHMLEYLKDANGNDVYPEFDRCEPSETVYLFQNVFGL